MPGLTRNGRRLALALAFGAGIAGLAATPAAARPGHGGDHYIRAITAFQSQLNLNTQQQGMWDAAVAASKAAREAARQNRQSVKQVAVEEMAKTTPDLSRIAATADQVRDASTAAHRQVRAQWLQLYATFTPEQVAVVKAGISRRMDRMERFREHMRDRFGKN